MIASPSAGLRYTAFRLHRAVLADTARSSPPQPAIRCWLRRHGEMSHRFPATIPSLAGQALANDRNHLRDNGYMPRRGWQDHNTPTYLSVWPDRSTMSGRHGARVLQRFMGRETRPWTPFLYRHTTQVFPCSAEQTTTSSPNGGEQRLHEQLERCRARQPFLLDLRARLHAFAAPAQEGMGRKFKATHVRHVCGKLR